MSLHDLIILQDKCEELETKLEICRNALKTIKHTECDTYRVAANALKESAEQVLREYISHNQEAVKKLYNEAWRGYGLD